MGSITEHKVLFVCFVVLIWFFNYFFSGSFLWWYIKSHHQAQCHLGFLCCLPGILWLFILYLGPWSCRVNLCKRCEIYIQASFYAWEAIILIAFLDMCLYRTMSRALCSVPMRCVLAPVPHCPAHYGFMRVLRLGRISLPTLFSFSSVLAVPGFVPLYMGVRTNLSITKKLSRVFIKIAFNLHPENAESSCPWTKRVKYSWKKNLQNSNRRTHRWSNTCFPSFVPKYIHSGKCQCELWCILNLKFFFFQLWVCYSFCKKKNHPLLYFCKGLRVDILIV